MDNLERAIVVHKPTREELAVKLKPLVEVYAQLNGLTHISITLEYQVTDGKIVYAKIKEEEGFKFL